MKKKNALKNRTLMKKLNPFNAVAKAQEKKTEEERHKNRTAHIKELRKKHKQAKVARRKAFNKLTGQMQDAFKKDEDEWNRFGAEEHEADEEELAGEDEPEK